MTRITIVTRRSEGVAGGTVAFDRDFVWAIQMTVDAAQFCCVFRVDIALNFRLVAERTERLFHGVCAGILRVNFVAVQADDADLAVIAALPLGFGRRVTTATEIRRGSNRHTFLGVLGTIRAVTGFAGDTSQHKLAAACVIAGGVTGETLTRLLNRLHIRAHDWVKERVGVAGVAPRLVDLLVTFPAALGTLVAGAG